ncbi:26S proteasome regulatory subunit rpn6 [Penicillium atrosanguineum]|uniref:Mitochondrial export translocase Oxa2 n=1 Tax=Penicillium atrosanguineum TaxID=1132637 RepID=A0A9W9Q1R9_9EURO|nr:26S proteasome regulatory subunit rpn6 [Penicillium atrosanguineum]KAJ5298571.1 26S proteasome regulatory subunit rpn6 [Penicillium atrosanguineum]KAJ5321164.1 mitochondrial export translocase Oxa2 [Penicillium atrosanguineum]
MAAIAMNNIRFMGALRPPTRAFLVNRRQIRHFHPTRPTRLVAEVLDVSSGFIHGVHSITHLPWVASIPLTAVIVRMLVGMPLQFITRVNARRERDIAPLIHSWRIMGTNKMQQLPAKEQKDRKKRLSNFFIVMSKTLSKKWKIMPGYRFLNLLQLPIWLSLMESMRAMTGNQNGIIPYLLSFVSGQEGAASLPALEPSLATEGALWFPDLLAGDPTGTLPLLLSASIILNIRRGWGITTPAGDLADLPTAQLYRATFFRGLGIFLQILGLNIGMAAFANELPAALMIYWITSTNVATLQTFLLEKYMFMRPPIPNFQKKYMVYQRPGVSDPFKLKLT